ncbi:6-bladed beta-propeller [Roseivirga misakiensis]|uniref:6-bladed beta-propeller n=1 Tax=Roseivirga misakiensis TaxID=1563681 RepID=A0A1E5T594_9BACT|nr:6-bladed beta-propeller [Roseivirga misakiensis]OEK06555.1 hypothetical protein BFP71_02470 [Roseivirga misakiensis]
MYKNTILPLLAALLFLWSCGNEVEQTGLEVIKVDVKNAEEVFLSDIASDVKYIPLETTDDNLIGFIREVEHSNDFVFISDYNSLYQFSLDGSFVRKISRKGEGPGEFLAVNSFTIDEQKGHIYLLAGLNGKLLCYDFEGKFLSEVKLPVLGTLNVINGQLVLLQTAYSLPSNKEGMRNNITYKITLSDNLKLGDSTIVSKVLVKAGTGAAMPAGMSFISAVNNNEYVYYPSPYEETFVRDTLYQIKEGRLIPDVKMDFGINDKTSSGFLLLNILRTNEYLISTYSLRRNSRLTLIHLPTLNSYTVEGGFQDDFFGTGEAKLVPWNSSKDEFYFIKDAYDLEGVIDEVNVDGNPYIFIASLKE